MAWRWGLAWRLARRLAPRRLGLAWWLVAWRLVARRPDLHVIVTGRNAKPAMIEAADLVTEMGAVKHHFSAGVKTQAGIEF